MFKFEYKDESELGPKVTLLAPGEGKFKIISVFDKKKDGSPLTTMDGTPKLTLSIMVRDCDGDSGLVYDDLTARTAWKIKALADALGLPGLYDESGTLNPDDLINGEGRCNVGTRKSDGYPDRTVIEKYLKSPKVRKAKADYSKELPEDDLPF